jgi:uncharacterized protein YuzE
MKVSYDVAGDILYLDLVERHGEQVTREVADGVLAEVNAESGALEGLEIWNFQRRAASPGGVTIPEFTPTFLEALARAG